MTGDDKICLFLSSNTIGDENGNETEKVSQPRREVFPSLHSIFVSSTGS